MKQGAKKREKSLLKDLENIRKQVIEGQHLNAAEKKMNELIQQAVKYYQDDLNFNMAQFYYEYGNILVSILEVQDQDMGQESREFHQVIDMQRNPDKEMTDAQAAFENLEASKSIIRTKIDSLNVEYHRLQDQLNQLKSQICDCHLFLFKTIKRIGDLQQWREDWNDALAQYEQGMNILQNQGLNQTKEMGEIYYKIGNVQLLQNEAGCEQVALKNLQKSFKLCYETAYSQPFTVDLGNLKAISKLKDELTMQSNNESEQSLLLLLMLLEKIEDTLMQIKESQECQAEINKWQEQEFVLDPIGRKESSSQLFHQFDPVEVQNVQYIGKISLKDEMQTLGQVIIKRIKRE